MKVRIGNRGMRAAWLTAAAVLAGGVTLGGCLDRPLKALNPCLVSGVVAEIAVTNIDKVDLLFMVDNSGSMKEEQAALQREFPKLIKTLTTGERPPKPSFPPAEDLHLGVVSSDMGLVGIQGIPGCDGLGDDGIMNNIPNATLGSCQATYPRFLTFVATVNDPDMTASDFTCIASLGTDGCGFEQQLESTLKALWPSVDICGHPNGCDVGPTHYETGDVIEPNRILFLGDSMGFGRLGHGDVENDGFLRNDAIQGISLIAIILVSDEEDCSSRDTRHFTPELYLDPNDPNDAQLLMQDLNLRCYYRDMADQGLPPEQKGLYEPDRYVAGLQALRPGNEKLVVFAAIVGVPPDLVSEDALKAVDFSDEAARNAYYDGILGDPRMQNVPDPSRPPGEGNLTPSCMTDNGIAYPPRRITQAVKGFGESGVLQSICQDNFGPAMDAIIEVIAKQLGAVCLPRSLVRNSDGLVGCNVVWELPVPGQAPMGTPTDCSALPYLSVPEKGKMTTDAGGAVCVVSQLAVMNKVTEMGKEGWYYDDFSTEVAQDCPAAAPQRIAFSKDAKPRTGVVVKLECLNESQSLANNRTDIMTGKDVFQPGVGDKCDEITTKTGQVLMGNEACAVTLKNGAADPDGTKDGKDSRMFCHPELNVCVLQCTTDADCPAAWVCDSRGETVMSAGKPICVNPTCGDLK